MDIKTLENELDKLEALKSTVSMMEKELIEELYQLERDAFNGMTYREFVNSQNQEIQINDKIVINVNGYRIYGSYRINDDVTMNVSLTVYTDNNGVDVKMIYNNRETKELPKKYQKEYDELVNKCLEFKIENPSKKYQEKYRLSMF